MIALPGLQPVVTAFANFLQTHELLKFVDRDVDPIYALVHMRPREGKLDDCHRAPTNPKC